MSQTGEYLICPPDRLREAILLSWGSYEFAIIQLSRRIYGEENTGIDMTIK